MGLNQAKELYDLTKLEGEKYRVSIQIDPNNEESGDEELALRQAMRNDSTRALLESLGFEV